MNNYIYPVAIIISILFLMTYVLLGLLGISLGLEPNESIGDISRWCERVSGGIFREPSNALSNIGFMIVGLLMFRVLIKDEEKQLNLNQFHGFTPISILYAAAVIYLGPGSMLMHGTHTEWGEWADNLSMIMYIIIPWLLNIKDMGRWSVKRFFFVYSFIVIIYAISRWFFGSNLGINLDLFGVSISLWIISESLYRFWSPTYRWISGFLGFFVAAIFGIMPTEIFSNFNEYWWILLFWLPAVLSHTAPTSKRVYNPWFFAGMLTYFVAFVIWLQGYPNTPYCNPDSFIQPHAIWHLITAFSTWCFFKFFRTEEKN
ncbi:MAG: ceramidase domain-containing protein [Pseudomonadota bacterium]|nr:ceramidase domain-containing protein [Pseudomonadota bacterium]